MVNELNKERIIELLKDNPQGLSIEDLASRSKLNRITVRVILTELIGEKQIFMRPVGQTKLHYWKRK